MALPAWRNTNGRRLNGRLSRSPWRAAIRRRADETETDRHGAPVAPRPRKGPLTEPTAGAQHWPRERVLMPLSGRSARPTV